MSIKTILFIMVIVVAYIICLVFQVPFLTIVMQLFLVIVIYFYVDRFFAERKNKEEIAKKLEVANKIVAENIDICIIIVGEDDDIIWANDETYDEFPILLEKRNIEAINLHEIDKENKITFNHKVYDVSLNDGIYTLRNITMDTRKVNNLKENATNIAYFQIDNYKYLNDTLDSSEFIKISNDMNLEINKMFETQNIFASRISSDRYILLIPTSTLNGILSNGFIALNNIFKKYQNEDYAVTFSLGISNSYINQKDTGKRAQDALELAITRGGAQTVIHIDDERKFYGTGSTSIKANTRLKARIINNTLTNILRRRDTVYIVTHANPDADALGSMILLAKLIRHKLDIEIRLVVDENIMPSLKYVLEMDKFIFSTAIDATKNNIVIVVDTQSSKIVSHPKLVQSIQDKIIFDHHQTPKDYIENPVFSWIEPGLSSTVEIITELLIISDIQIKDKEAANLAIMGVLIDTNQLKYRVDEQTLDTLSYHVSNGGNIQEARAKDYLDEEDFKTKHAILANYSLHDSFLISNCTGVKDDKILAMCVDAFLEMQKVQTVVLISEIDDEIKVKMRSKGDINAKLFLEEFGGGGHAAQAAGIFPLSYKEKIINKIMEEL